VGYLVNLEMEGRQAVVIGGGSIASRKVRDLLEAKAHILVVAPAADPEIRKLAAAGRVRWRRGRYSRRDLRGAFVAVAATDEEGLNARISRDAQARGILVNVVDRPALCTFTLPAVLRRGALTVAISTEGLCPAFASVMRAELAGRLGPEYAEAVRVLGELRRAMRARGWSGAAIRAAVERIYAAGIMEALRRPDLAALGALLQQALEKDFPLPPNLAAD
jgi:precorrin-2 dehydrogenase/sirohydrochlorin ferrochelatase